MSSHLLQSPLSAAPFSTTSVPARRVQMALHTAYSEPADVQQTQEKVERLRESYADKILVIFFLILH